MTVFAARRLGLIWGFDISPAAAKALVEQDLERAAAPGALRWVHLNLADQRCRRWIDESAALSAPVREALLAAEGHQRALIADGTVACAFHDLQREFDGGPDRMSVLGMAVSPGLVVTARLHPVQSPDIVRRRIESGARPISPAAALDLQLGAILEIASASTTAQTARVQHAEDLLLEHGHPPDPRTLLTVRRHTLLLSRQLGGLRAVLQRLEEDEDLPQDLLPAVARLSQRTSALGADVAALRSGLRQLREELDLQQAQRTNQNLYVLSILSALLLPATLVTGVFGMNTRGLPFIDSPAGGAVAVLLAFGAAFGVYLWLRLHGLFRR